MTTLSCGQNHFWRRGQNKTSTIAGPGSAFSPRNLNVSCCFLVNPIVARILTDLELQFHRQLRERMEASSFCASSLCSDFIHVQNRIYILYVQFLRSHLDSQQLLGHVFLLLIQEPDLSSGKSAAIVSILRRYHKKSCRRTSLPRQRWLFGGGWCLEMSRSKWWR